MEMGVLYELWHISQSVIYATPSQYGRVAFIFMYLLYLYLGDELHVY